MTSRILLRRGTAAQWASANPILGSGELGVETDTLKFKIGNGTSTWTQLTSYANITPSDLTSAINGLINAAPSALDTLNELAAAINNDSSFSTTVNNLLSGKVSKSGGDIITAATASTTPLAIRGAASQTADLLVWQNNSGTTFGRISYNGVLINQFNYFQNVQSLGGGSGLYLDGSSTIAFNTAPSQVVFKVAGYASQTADLQQWQNSSGTVLAKVDASGMLAVGNTTGTIQIKSTGTSAAYPSSGSGIELLAGTAAGTDAIITYNRDTSAWRGLSIYSSPFRVFNAGVEYLTVASNNSVGINNPTVSNVTLGIVSNSASNVTVAVKGAASQTADLQQWVDSAGTVLTKVDASGVTSVRSIRSANTIPNASVVDNTLYNLGVGPNASSYGISWLRVKSGGAGDVVSVFEGTTSQTGDLTQWRNSAGTAIAAINASGDIAIRNIYASTNAGYYTAQVNILPDSAAKSGIVVRSATSQTANLQEWQDSNGSIMSKVSSSGDIYAVSRSVLARFVQADSGAGTYIDLGFNNANSVSIVGRTSTTAPQLIVKGIASQTGDLQQWQNSAGTTLVNVKSDGKVGFGATIGDKIHLYNTEYGIGIQAYALVLFAAPDPAGRVSIRPGYGSGNADAIELFTSGRIKQTLTEAGSVGNIIKGAASQTANLQEWQNNNGSALLSIDSTGAIQSGSSGINLFASPSAYRPYFNLRNTTNDSNAGYIVLDKRRIANAVLNNDILGSIAFRGYTGIADNGGAYIIASADENFSSTSGPARLSFWTTPSGSVTELERMRISSTGTVTINGFVAGAQGLVVQGAASQTANLQEWQNSSGTVIANITPAGKIAMKHINGINGDMLSLGSNGASDIFVVGYNSSSSITYINGGTYGPIQVQLNSAANGKFVIKGAASQSANLQEWQNSAGTVLVSIGANGTLGINGTPPTNTKAYIEENYTGNYGANTALRARGTGSSASNWKGRIIAGGDTVAFLMGEYNSQAWLGGHNAALDAWSPLRINPDGTEDLYLGNRFWNPGNSPILTIKNSNGKSGFNNSTPNGQLDIFTTSASNVGLIIRGYASQTANLQEWQDSNGTVKASIDKDGSIITYGATSIGTTRIGTSILSINTGYLANPGIIIRGQSGQTADLQQWQDSAGTVLAKVTASGGFELNGKDIEIMNIMGAY